MAHKYKPRHRHPYAKVFEEIAYTAYTAEYKPSHRRTLTGGRMRRKVPADSLPLITCPHEKRGDIFPDDEMGRLLRPCQDLACPAHRPNAYAVYGARHKKAGW